MLVCMIHPSSRTGEEKEVEEEEGRGTNEKKKSSWVGRDELSFVSVLMKLEDGIIISSQYVPSIDWLIGVCCSDPNRGQGLGRKICLLLEMFIRETLSSTRGILCLGNFSVTCNF